jgi:hypothetical protein
MRVPVLRATLLARVNRRLLKDGRRVRRSRSGAMRKLAGDWVMVDDHGIVRKNVDLVALARELECLEPWETLR